MTALRALLAGIVDYAGLFPPAGLDMPAAVRTYAAYRAEDDAWMLGRFVIPIARLRELDDALRAMGDEERPVLRLTGILGADCAVDIATARAFNASHSGRASIDSLEAVLPTPGAIERAATASTDGPFALFAEVPLDPDPASLIEVIQRAGVSAKVRLGGVTPDAFPVPELVVRFLRRAIDAGLRFKATAGLHHPLRGEYAVRYDAGAPIGLMYGYLNVFLAAGFMTEGMRDVDAIRLLEERRANAFHVSASTIGWGDFRLTAPQLRRIRGDVAISFGSCSFREPVDELRALAIL